MVDDDELERHVRRVDDELPQPGDTDSTADVDERIEELEATVMRVAEELANRIEDVDRGMPPAETVGAIEDRLAAIEDRLAAIENRLDDSGR